MVNHDKLLPILEAICFSCDYGKDSRIKAEELMDRIRPLNQNLEHKDGVNGMYGILHFTLEILKDLECTNVVNAEKSLSQKKD